MTDLAGRLQRRAEGAGLPMLPFLPDRPLDPRFGPTSPLSDPFHDSVEDAFAEPPTLSAVQPIDQTPARAVTVVVRDNIVTRDDRQGVIAAPSVPEVQARSLPVRVDTRGADPPSRTTGPSTTFIPGPLIQSSALAAPDLNPRPEPRVSMVATAAPATSSDRPPSLEPHRESASGVRSNLPPAQALRSGRSAEAPLNPVHLEPRPREPHPPVDAALDPPAPRVVIGNLHIEVVRAPAAPTPRREPPRRESHQGGRPTTTTPTRTRRRTVFGLGQL